MLYSCFCLVKNTLHSAESVIRGYTYYTIPDGGSLDTKGKGIKEQQTNNNNITRKRETETENSR